MAVTVAVTVAIMAAVMAAVTVVMAVIMAVTETDSQMARRRRADTLVCHTANVVGFPMGRLL